MKRRLEDTRETLNCPTIQGSCTRELMNIRPFFRFPSRPSEIRLTSLMARQIRPFYVEMNPRAFYNAMRPKSNVPGAHQLHTAMAPFKQRLSSWRSAVEYRRLPSNLTQFQEMPTTFAWGHLPQSTRVGYHVSQKVHANNTMVRQWEVLPEDRSSSPRDFTFSVVSYNLLSDQLLFENKFLYEACSEDVLNWEFRKENLLKELLSYNADILCLQEVDSDHYEDWFKPKLSEAGYGGVYNQRTGEKPDGCVTFYKVSKFTLVKKKLVKYYTRNVPVLNKDNVGIVVLLKASVPEVDAQKIESGEDHSRVLCVANTHLLFNKKRGDIKLAQLAYLLAEVDSLATLNHDGLNKVYCPVILCGDLNSLPFSPLHFFLTKGVLEYSTRNPAVISGQLPHSESTSSSRCIGTPLLPWHFGVTMGCQWRNLRSVADQDGEDDSSTSGNNSEVEMAEHGRTSVMTIPFPFVSVYKHRFEDGTAEVTTCHSKACCNVDYIFYTLGMRDGKYKDDRKYSHKGTLTLLGKLQLPRKPDFDVVKQLPNEQFSSDHLSLLALFKLS